MCLIHSKGLDILTNYYDLVLEFNRETEVITNIVQIPWYYDRYMEQYGFAWRPETYLEEQHYNEFHHQFTPYIRIRKDYSDVPGASSYSGKYKGDLEAIKVGDVLTDEMKEAHIRFMSSNARNQIYPRQKDDYMHFAVVGFKMDLVGFYASAWHYGDISSELLIEAVNKGLITVEEQMQIVNVHRSRNVS